MSEKKERKTDKTDSGDVCANPYRQTLHSQFVAQWITSLAISIICCSVLFIVFASYVVDIHDRTNLLNVRIEVLQDQVKMLHTDNMLIKHRSALPPVPPHRGPSFTPDYPFMRPPEPPPVAPPEPMPVEPPAHVPLGLPPELTPDANGDIPELPAPPIEAPPSDPGIVMPSSEIDATMSEQSGETETAPSEETPQPTP